MSLDAAFFNEPSRREGRAGSQGCFGPEGCVGTVPRRQDFETPTEQHDQGSPTINLGNIMGESLNADPYNVHAEELALQDCMFGVDVRRIWSEKEMVCSFGGRHFPGTPDGMFETWDGVLTCVQVVRVPFAVEANSDSMKDSLYHTILTKVVKSQQWLRASHVVPQNFIIFCWLPIAIPDEVAQDAEELMMRVQTMDPRFSLRLRVPAHASSLFPAMFACNYDRERQKSRAYSWSDMTTYNSSDVQSDEDECCPWDVFDEDTWIAYCGGLQDEEDCAWEMEKSAGMAATEDDPSIVVHNLVEFSVARIASVDTLLSSTNQQSWRFAEDRCQPCLVCDDGG